MPTDHANSADEHHLRLLSIFQYILAGITALAGCFSLTYFGLGIAMFAGVVDFRPIPMLPELGLILAFVGAVLTVFVCVMCVVELLAARSLGNHTSYRFCFVVACLELLNFPLGTIVGIFEIIVLSRPSVRALYAGAPERYRHADALDDLDEDDDAGPPIARGTARDGSIQERPPNP